MVYVAFNPFTMTKNVKGKTKEDLFLFPLIGNILHLFCVLYDLGFLLDLVFHLFLVVRAEKGICTILSCCNPIPRSVI